MVRSLPGLGTILGARVLGEFGDEPNRYATAKSRKNYAGTSPITRASGTKKAVLARHVRNQRLADAIYLWAFAALTASPGARAFYDAHRAAGDTHHHALRALGNRLVGILHGCLEHHSRYDEHIAWGHRTTSSPGRPDRVPATSPLTLRNETSGGDLRRTRLHQHARPPAPWVAPPATAAPPAASATTANSATAPITVEVDMGSATSRGRPPDRAWLVRIRRGDTLRHRQHRPTPTTADRLAEQLTDLLTDKSHRTP